MSVEIFDVVPEKLEYWPGETVKGNVILKVKGGSIQSQGIYLNLKGVATVEITEQIRHHTSRTKDRRSSTRIYTNFFSDSESLLSINSFLVGDGATTLNLWDGETSYPFSFQLPPRLVSSYYRSNGPLPLGWSAIQGTGQVSYYLELGMMIGGGRTDHTSKKIIGIHSQLDLAAVPEASQAGGAEITETFCRSWACCGCQSGPLTLKVRTAKRGFLPGETVAFEVEVNNQSKRIIKNIAAHLIEATTMRGQGRTESVTTILVGMVVSDQKFEGGDGNWSGELVVPQEGQVYPTKLGGGCKILDVNYCLKIIARLEGCCTADVEVVSSITIGTCRSATLVPSAGSKPLFSVFN